MHSQLKKCLDKLGSNTELEWVPARGGVHVQLAPYPHARSVKVEFLVEGDDLWIRAIIIQSKWFRFLFPREDREFRMASFIWQTNARNELVTIGLSTEGDLVAGIYQPLASVDPQELRTYVNNVAVYSDRLGHVLKDTLKP